MIIRFLTAVMLISGAIITFAARGIAIFLLKGKREMNEADLVYIKLVGFGLVLAAVIIIFFG